MRQRAGWVVLGMALMTGRAEALSITVVGGILTGASRVSVNGALYDVMFLDGTCAGLFDGCDAVSDFEFRDAASANAAAQALLDQVFRDVGAGNFDTDPTITQGCGYVDSCAAYTPFEFAGGDHVSASRAYNHRLDTQDGVYSGGLDPSFQSAASIDTTWAVWTAPTASVSDAPSTLLLLGLSSMGLGFCRRRWGGY